MFKNEAAATTHWLKEQRNKYEEKCRLYKIPDIWNTIKPCDVLWHIEWVGVAIELKFFNIKRDITKEDILKNCSRQQLVTLETYSSWGGRWILVWYNRQTNKFYQFDY